MCSVTITETKENIFYTAENKYCGLKCVSFELEKLFNFNVMHINLASKRMIVHLGKFKTNISEQIFLNSWFSW